MSEDSVRGASGGGVGVGVFHAVVVRRDERTDQWEPVRDGPAWAEAAGGIPSDRLNHMTGWVLTAAASSPHLIHAVYAASSPPIGPSVSILVRSGNGPGFGGYSPTDAR